MNQKKYTHTPIKGITPTTTLPEGTALVLEGGGTRGFFSSGVFEEFMEAGIMFPYIIGVSAGAANALSYISGQKGRSRQIVTHYVSDKRYVSKRNLIRYRTLFGYEFIFETVPNEHIFWDMENFNRTQTRYLVGVTDCATGEAAWLEKADFATEADVLMANKASCSVPMVAKIVNIGGTDYLDGGIAAPIPIEKSVADGNKFHVIVL
ncbi:MAG: patatin family protein, partial [Defluviitaleaceae bacterium]|nr:patatin family protein [Defluviitaleaceae bacterium]